MRNSARPIAERSVRHCLEADGAAGSGLGAESSANAVVLRARAADQRECGEGLHAPSDATRRRTLVGQRDLPCAAVGGVALRLLAGTLAAGVCTGFAGTGRTFTGRTGFAAAARCRPGALRAAAS